MECIFVVKEPHKGCIDMELWKARYPRMHQAAREGLPAEVLAWKMNIEDPKAASVIRRALNQKNRCGNSTPAC